MIDIMILLYLQLNKEWLVEVSTPNLVQQKEVPLRLLSISFRLEDYNPKCTLIIN